MPGGVVDHIVVDVDHAGADLDVMPAIARLKAGIGDGHLVIEIEVDRMGAGQAPVAPAQMGEGGTVDGDGAFGIIGGQNAFVAVLEPALHHGQVALFQPDPRAIAILAAVIGEDEAFHPRRSPAQHQPALALAQLAIHDHLARHGGLKGDIARHLHPAFAVMPGVKAQGDGAALDGEQRVPQLVEPLPAFHDRIGLAGRLNALRRGGTSDQRGEDQERAHHGPQLYRRGVNIRPIRLAASTPATAQRARAQLSQFPQVSAGRSPK